MRLIDLMKKRKEKELELVCANPECKRPIRIGKVAWMGDNEFYHPRCVEYAIALKAFTSNKIVSGEIYYLSREQALIVKSKLDAQEINN